MNCPHCNYPRYNPNKACSHCKFKGDPALIQELHHLNWLIKQMEDWEGLELEADALEKIENKYVSRHRAVEIDLGLRAKPFSPEEVEQKWKALIHREILQERLTEWYQNNKLKFTATKRLRSQLDNQIAKLEERLDGYEEPSYPETDEDYLALTNFIIAALDYLGKHKGFKDKTTETELRDELNNTKETLEINLGLRLAPPTEASLDPTTEAQPEASIESQPIIEKPIFSPIPEADIASKPTAKPQPTPTPAKLARPPLAERIWRSLLSERTLQVILFLGIFLLFAAALSFVAWGWRNFHPLMRVAIPIGFTGLFFVIGRYIRLKTDLYRSGLALSAIAALLIPIDLYTIYANFDILQYYSSPFWLVSSVICVGAYIFSTLLIKSRFFTYLIVTAAGSTVLALNQIFYELGVLSLDWRSAALSLLGAGFIILAIRLERNPPKSPPLDWAKIFGQPFRLMPLLSIGFLMLVSLAWRYLGRYSIDSLHYSMTITWLIGSFIFAWGAFYYSNRALGEAAAFSLPIATYSAQAALFNQLGINTAWHSFGLALLVPVYLMVGYRLSNYKDYNNNKDDKVTKIHSRTAINWGVILLVISALLALTNLDNGLAAASTHAVLAVACILATRLWRRPVYLYGASFFSLSALSFAFIQQGFGLDQLSPAWMSLSLIHIVIALKLNKRAEISIVKQNTNTLNTKTSSFLDTPESEIKEDSQEKAEAETEKPITITKYYASPIAIAGYAVAALAILPVFVLYNGAMLIYVVGHWIGLSIWGARLAHLNQPGFSPPNKNNKALFHWFIALALPLWLYVLFSNARPIDFSFSLALTALAWAMAAISYRLKKVSDGDIYGNAWYITAWGLSIVEPLILFNTTALGFAFSISLIVIGLFFMVDALVNRWSFPFIPGAFVLAWGYHYFLTLLNLPSYIVMVGLTMLVSLYYLLGLYIERRKSEHYTAKFLRPLYLSSHVIAFTAILSVYLDIFNVVLQGFNWSDQQKVWGAAAHLLLGSVYGVYAWGRYKERWAHLAAWLGAFGAGFIAIAYSQGRGSSAAKAALVAIAFVLAERGLWAWRQRKAKEMPRRTGAIARLVWWLYRRPLLVTGWIISAGTIFLALVRNLVFLGAGDTHKFWAWVGLTLIVGLYALSARLFRLARFAWLAAFLVFAPWTILTNVGWYIFNPPSPTGYAISWLVLAWGLFLLGVFIRQKADKSYALPPFTVSQLLIPFSLLWGVANVQTSRFTFLMAILLYALAAYLNWFEDKRTGTTAATLNQSKFFYPALGLIPVWCIYLLAWLMPTAQHQHYGLMLLVFGPLGIITGQLLKRLGRNEKQGNAYALPAYLTGYIVLIVATMLVAHVQSLLAITLLFDSALLIISAWLFKNPLWLYPASVLVPISLLITLSEINIPANRHGWGLISLAAFYLVITWALRRFKLAAYSTPTLTLAFALIALGLPPSSQDQIGALVGYGGAAVLYIITAIWLKQPLLLTPAMALIIVPYAVVLQRSGLSPAYYGLALLPGAIVALTVGWQLDRKFEAWQNYPWLNPLEWGKALVDRLLNWWALPLYALGFGLAMASPFFTQFRADLSALSFVLLMPIFGWAIHQFRLRGWLLALGIAGHLAVIVWFNHLYWWRDWPLVWLKYTPLTIITVLAAVALERYFKEGSPFEAAKWWPGWSRPLYVLAAIDLVIVQLASLDNTEASALITLCHLLLIAGLASLWLEPWLAYVSTILGLFALSEWAFAQNGSEYDFPVVLTLLALLYGLIGYGITLIRRRLFQDKPFPPQASVWEKPLEASALVLSIAILGLTFVLGINLVGWTISILFGASLEVIVNVNIAYMVIRVFSLLGLLYLATAFIRQWPRMGYGAVGMMISAWLLYILFIQERIGLPQLQRYAIPAGLYLLGISYLEWQRGQKKLARWIDYGTLGLMIGSLFWQILFLGADHWGYFLTLILEGLLFIAFGTVRRLRHFLYGGMIGVVVAVLGQLVSSLLSINQWLVFGLIGLLLVVTAIAVERKLEDLKAWQALLETWE